MSAYLLFLPGLKQADQFNALDKVGLAEICRGEPMMTAVEIKSGPEDKPGLLLFWFDSQHSGNAHYSPGDQTWCKLPMPAEKETWLGTVNSRPLQPKDIQRLAFHPNTMGVRLEDGNIWQIPIASALPHLWGITETGEETRVPKPEFAEFCAHAAQAYERTLSNEATIGNLQYASKALSLNYRLAMPIISALGLVGDSCGLAIIMATIEVDLIRAIEAQKKTAGS